MPTYYLHVFFQVFEIMIELELQKNIPIVFANSFKTIGAKRCLEGLFWCCIQTMNYISFLTGFFLDIEPSHLLLFNTENSDKFSSNLTEILS